MEPCDSYAKKCLNGATCRRLTDFEAKCECRIPFTGKFCGQVNLCDIGHGRCIDDLRDFLPGHPHCYPCKNPEAVCSRRPSSQFIAYTCSCESAETLCEPSSINIFAFSLEVSDMFRYRVPKNLVVNQTGEFTVIFPVPDDILLFLWDFGDGSTKKLRYDPNDNDETDGGQRKKRQAESLDGESQFYLFHTFFLPQ